LKVIILHAGEEDQFWLHIIRIKRIYTHKFANYIQTLIDLENDYQVQIIDHHKLFDFKKFVYQFINSEKKIEILKVTEFQYNNKWCKMQTKDWVEQVVDERAKNV
jgi:hypothetical protein